MSDKETLIRAIKKIKKIGGSSMVVLPSHILNELGIPAGSEVAIRTPKGLKKKIIELEWFG